MEQVQNIDSMGRSGDIFFLIAIALMIIPVISASSFFVEQNSNYSIKFSCNIDGSLCSNTSVCAVSIDYPNSTSLITNNISTNLLNAKYEYNLSDNQTQTVGEHKLKIDCYDGDLNGTSTIIYEVNPTGIRSSDSRTATISRAIWFIFGIGIILFIAFLFATSSIPVKWTFFILSILFFLIGINILFISLQDEIVNPRLENFFDGFTAISWYFYWFAAGVLALMWFLTFLNTWLYKKNLKNMSRYE